MSSRRFLRGVLPAEVQDCCVLVRSRLRTFHIAYCAVKENRLRDCPLDGVERALDWSWSPCKEDLTDLVWS
jgi:hypothetical protein